MWPFKKKEPKYKVDWNKIKTMEDLNNILKVYFEDKMFYQKAIEDFPEIKTYLKKKE